MTTPHLPANWARGPDGEAIPPSRAHLDDTHNERSPGASREEV